MPASTCATLVGSTGGVREAAVKLETVEVDDGESNDVELFSERSKLYRLFQGEDESQEWKERGIGLLRLLQNKDNGRVRMILRQEKTGKIMLSHVVAPSLELQENASVQNSFVWSAIDFSEAASIEDGKIETFLARFKTDKQAADFQEQINYGKEVNGDEDKASAAAAKLREASPEKEETEGDKEAEAVAKEEQAEDKEASAELEAGKEATA
ncbi:MAG: hypothetical protein MHM6MM_006792 [Cercozoa sp. M6MM]